MTFGKVLCFILPHYSNYLLFVARVTTLKLHGNKKAEFLTCSSMSHALIAKCSMVFGSQNIKAKIKQESSMTLVLRFRFRHVTIPWYITTVGICLNMKQSNIILHFYFDVC